MNEKTRRLFCFILAGAAGILTALAPLPFPEPARVMLGIIATSMVLWVTEVIPLGATGLLVGLLLILAGKYPADLVFASYFDKVVVLVLGGFALAVALGKHHLDDYLSQKLLGKFGGKPHFVILGALLVTGALSMWISNSAAAALCMPIVVAVLKRNTLTGGKSNFGKAMVIAVAYGATIGGLGTLIGSTPNVLAQKFLTNEGISFGFLEWGVRGFPFMAALLLVTWLILLFVFKPEIKKVKMLTHPRPFTRQQKMVAGIFLLTVGLWVTESIHGINSSVIAVVPIILLFATRLLDNRDFSKMGWDSLLLIGGGIALGMGIDQSGLGSVLAQAMGTSLLGQPAWMVFLIMGVVGIGLTSFLSNTAASALIIPTITALSNVLKTNTTNLVVASAAGVSLDFILPMGTPPTAIAASSGYIHVKDIMKTGILVSLAGALLLMLFATFTW